MGIPSWADYGESKELFEGIEVAISVQEGMFLSKTERSNQAIDGLAHGVTLLTKLPKIPSRRDSHLHPARLENLKLAEFALHSREGDIVANTLKDLTEDQIC